MSGLITLFVILGLCVVGYLIYNWIANGGPFKGILDLFKGGLTDLGGGAFSGLKDLGGGAKDIGGGALGKIGIGGFYPPYKTKEEEEEEEKNREYYTIKKNIYSS